MRNDLPVFEELYDLGPELGRGTFGAVHRATRRSDGSAAAAKLLREASPEARARVRREAELVRGLEHPHLVRLHGLFADAQGAPILVYDLVEGTTLEAQVRSGEVEPSQVAAWVRQLASALAALHGAGLVHRDLKPENVMVDDAGRARLLDYGLARPEEQGRTMTAEGLVLGTPAYMAPEIFDGARPSPADDVYALACLAYTALAGSPAHRGDDPFQILSTKRHPPPPLPRLACLSGAQLEALDAVLGRALAPQGGTRYPDPGALAQAVEGALAGGAPEGGKQGAPDVAPTAILRRTRPRSPTHEPARAPEPMSTGIFLRRTVTRVGPVLFGAILVGLGFHLGGTPVPPKAPVSAATPAAARSSPARLLAEAAVRELEAAEDLWIDDQGTVRPRPADGRVPEGGRPLVGNDPLLFGPCLEQMPALTEHYARRARGEVEWHDLPEEDRAALQQVAADFMGQGLPDPFWPLLDVGPGEAVRPEDEDARRHLEEVKFEAERRERVLPTQGPWLQTTWARVARARRLGEALEEELESLSSPLVRTLGVQQAVMVTSDPHGVFAGHFQQPLLRPELERVLRDERRAYQGAMWAVGRTIRFGTPEEGEEAAHLLWVIAGDYRFLFFSHLAQVEPEALLGIQGTTPAGARAVFRISDTQRRARVATPERIRNHGPDRLAELADRMVEGPLDSGVEVTRAREGLGYFADLQRERGGDDFDRRRDRLLVRLDGPHAEWYRVELGGVR